MNDATSAYWRKILKLEKPVDKNILKKFHSPFEAFRPAYFILFSFLCRTFCRLTIKGLDNIPAKTPYIIAPNHLSILDHAIVSLAMGQKRCSEMYTLSSRHFFDNPFARFFMRIGANVIRLDREADYLPALSTAAQVLRLGKAIYINPEGTRSKTGEMQPFKVGVGVLAVETGSPIIPVLIEGTFKVLRPGSLIPRPHDLSVTFGKPINMDEYQKRKENEMAFNVYKDVADELFKRVLSLKVG